MEKKETPSGRDIAGSLVLDRRGREHLTGKLVNTVEQDHPHVINILLLTGNILALKQVIVFVFICQFANLIY